MAASALGRPAPKNSPGGSLRERYYAKIDAVKAELLAESAQDARAPRTKAPPARFAPYISVFDLPFFCG